MTPEQAKTLRSNPEWEAFKKVLMSDMDALKEELVGASTQEDMIRVQEKIKVIRLVIARLDSLCDDEE
jgi:hypothetical protein